MRRIREQCARLSSIGQKASGHRFLLFPPGKKTPSDTCASTVAFSSVMTPTNGATSPFHFHGFDDNQSLALFDLSPNATSTAITRPGIGDSIIPSEAILLPIYRPAAVRRAMPALPQKHSLAIGHRSGCAGRLCFGSRLPHKTRAIEPKPQHVKSSDTKTRELRHGSRRYSKPAPVPQPVTSMHQVRSRNQLCAVAFNKAGINAASDEVRVAGSASQKACVGSHWPDLDLATGLASFSAASVGLGHEQ